MTNIYNIKPKSIYVGASSSELDRADRCMDMLRSAGFIVTSTWTETIKTVGDANPRDAARCDRVMWSATDLRQVEAADTLWMLVPAVGTGRGAYAELGYAKGRDKLLVTSGDTKQSIFCAMTHEFADDIEAFANICRWARDGIHLASWSVLS